MPLSRLGVCSWSLQPDSPPTLLEHVSATGISHVQLALTPLVSNRDVWADTIGMLTDAGINVISGMIEPVGEDYSTIDSIKVTGGIRPSAHWPANEAMLRAAAVVAADAGVSCITLHAGFLPHDPADAERAVMVQRLQAMADICADQGLTLGLETGQEDADTLLAVLGEIDRANLGVNFDPANMVLYGTGEPIAALEALRDHVVQVHIKDALPPVEHGQWGSEEPVGEGIVDWDAFLTTVNDIKRPLDAVIEREAGTNRVQDIRTAADRVQGAIA
ncbi:MAG: sugar phosphate isomerase/epimerase [Phycisphaerales bacterium]|nr:sugar phosphate isomerase/epimerase [Phycisphaerales bacterium]